MRSHYLFCQNMFSLLIIYDQERNHHIWEAEKKEYECYDWIIKNIWRLNLIFVCVKYPQLSSDNVVLSDRWADVFSAKGCHDTTERGFSHPFVQVKYKTTGNSIV